MSASPFDTGKVLARLRTPNAFILVLYFLPFNPSSTFLLVPPFRKEIVMSIFWISLTLLALPFLARTGAAHPGHSHEIRSPLPETWFHPRDHPVHSLFRRQTGTGPPTDGITYPQVGSPSPLPYLSSCCPALTVFWFASNSLGSRVSREHSRRKCDATSLERRAQRCGTGRKDTQYTPFL